MDVVADVRLADRAEPLLVGRPGRRAAARQSLPLAEAHGAEAVNKLLINYNEG